MAKERDVCHTAAGVNDPGYNMGFRAGGRPGLKRLGSSRRRLLDND